MPKKVTGDLLRIEKEKKGFVAPDRSYRSQHIMPIPPAASASRVRQFVDGSPPPDQVIPISKPDILAQKMEIPVQSMLSNRIFGLKNSPTGCTANGIEISRTKQYGPEIQ